MWLMTKGRRPRKENFARRSGAADTNGYEQERRIGAVTAGKGRGGTPKAGDPPLLF